MVTMFQNVAFTERLSTMDSLKVMGAGLLVVFAVLAILIVLIEVLHAAFKDRKTEVKQEVKAEQKPEERISAGVMAEVPEASVAEQDGDFIAAISAVITCATGSADFKIKSIKKG